MSESRFQRFCRSRFVWAAACGLLLAAAFPKPGVALLAWLAPGLLLLCGAGQSPGRAFRIGWVAGLAFNLAALYWLNFIPYPVMPTIGWLALSAYLALYPATWLAAAVWCFKFEVSSSFHATTAWRAVRDRLAAVHWVSRAGCCLLGAAVWVALEMVMSRFLTGFPWLLLGNSQYELLPLVQLAACTGVPGISFLLVWCSLALLCAVAVLARNPARPWAWLGEVALPLMALGGVLSSGLLHLVGARAHAPELTFALIQPSVPQQVKWDRDANRQAFAKVMDLSRAALALKPDVLVWPEAVTPGFLRYDDELRAAVTGLAREHKVWLILGADDATAKAGNPDEADYFNSAFLVSPEGRVLGKYDKQRLVIFGEYVPLARWLPFLKWFTPVEGGFTPGRQAVPFELGEPGLTLQVLICFEDVFAGHVRRCLDTDTQLLLNLTNNGWFGESAAQWQHAAMSVFRAVETGRPMVRCTNNGLTCWIDPAGRMHEVYFGDSKDIYGAGFKMARVPLYGRGTPLYSRWPQDWFGWLCVVVAGAWLLRRVMRRRRSPGRLEST